jgi:hypothetical protein
MSFKKHETKEQKKIRRLCYQILRAAGITSRKACIFRDWTNNKVIMIALGEAVPIR